MLLQVGTLQTHSPPTARWCNIKQQASNIAVLSIINTDCKIIIQILTPNLQKIKIVKDENCNFRFVLE